MTAESVAARLEVSQTAARRAIGLLEDAGVLRSISERQRDRAWAAGDALDEAESLVGRIAAQPERLLTPRTRAFLASRGLIAST